MISLDEALRIVLSHAERLSSERVDILDSLGCILAQPIIAREDHPPFTSSAVDGFAICTEDVLDASVTQPMRLRVIATVRAGEESSISVQPKTAVRIMTGTTVPKGADAVIMQEHVDQDSDEILVHRSVPGGENVRYAGEELKAGEVVLEVGTHITPAVISLLAGLGYRAVEIYRKPWVSIITTGDELVSITENVGQGKIRDSNALFLKSALQELRIDEVEVKAGVKDDRERLFSALESALDLSDVVIVTGGVSVGEFDFVKSILSSLGVQEHFWGIKVKPGKPTYFGVKGKTLVFGLPGNPVAVGVLFYELVRPALLAMMGWRDGTLPRLKAVLEGSLHRKTPRLELVRGQVFPKQSALFVVPLKKQESHMLSGFAKANCLICLPEDKDTIEGGSEVEIHTLPWANLLHQNAISMNLDMPLETKGKVVAISVSKRRGIPKSNVKSATLIEDWGIEGDIHGGKWHRQVSLLAIESIEKMRAKGLNVRPGAFAENITTAFIDVPCVHVGDRIRIGETELEITQIGKECHRKCAIFYRAGDCVMPKEGVFARVVKGGTIRVGDEISLLSYVSGGNHVVDELSTSKKAAEIVENAL